MNQTKFLSLLQNIRKNARTNYSNQAKGKFDWLDWLVNNQLDWLFGLGTSRPLPPKHSHAFSTVAGTNFFSRADSFNHLQTKPWNGRYFLMQDPNLIASMNKNTS